MRRNRKRHPVTQRPRTRWNRRLDELGEANDEDREILLGPGDKRGEDQ